MSKVSKLAVIAAFLPVVAFSAPAFATSNPGQIEFGDIYRAQNVTTNSAFADNVTASCGDTVAFRVRIHNGGPATLTNVKVAASLVTASGTSHGSTVTVTADNNLDNSVVTANAGFTTGKASIANYVKGSTQLLNYSATPGGETVIQNLPDGILSGSVNIGSVGPTTPQTEEVQFEVKADCGDQPPQQITVCDLSTKKVVTIDQSEFDSTKYSTDLSKCASTPPTPNQITVCDLSTKQVVNIDQKNFDSTKYSKDLTKCVTTPPTPPTTLVNTGAGSVAGIAAAVAAVSAVAYNVVRRRAARQ